MGSSSSFLLLPSSEGKQSQLLLKPNEVELGLQVGVEFDNINNTEYCKSLLIKGKSLNMRVKS